MWIVPVAGGEAKRLTLATGVGEDRPRFSPDGKRVIFESPRDGCSTQIYLHVTAHDLRVAAERHPIGRLLGTIAHFLPNVRLPFQRPGARCAAE